MQVISHGKCWSFVKDEACELCPEADSPSTEMLQPKERPSGTASSMADSIWCMVSEPFHSRLGRNTGDKSK